MGVAPLSEPTLYWNGKTSEIMEEQWIGEDLTKIKK